MEEFYELLSNEAEHSMMVFPSFFVQDQTELLLSYAVSTNSYAVSTNSLIFNLYVVLYIQVNLYILDTLYSGIHIADTAFFLREDS